MPRRACFDSYAWTAGVCDRLYIPSRLPTPLARSVDMVIFHSKSLNGGQKTIYMSTKRLKGGVCIHFYPINTCLKSNTDLSSKLNRNIDVVGIHGVFPCRLRSFAILFWEFVQGWMGYLFKIKCLEVPYCHWLFTYAVGDPRTRLQVMEVLKAKHLIRSCFLLSTDVHFLSSAWHPYPESCWWKLSDLRGIYQTRKSRLEYAWDFSVNITV